MFSIILISHGQMSQGILHSSEMIFGKQEDVVAVSLNPDEGPDDFRKKLEEAIASLGNTKRSFSWLTFGAGRHLIRQAT